MSEAEAAYRSGDVHRCYEVARAGLAEAPDDARLLALAGRAALDLGRSDAVTLLERLTEVSPAEHRGWHDLGSALLQEGDLRGAESSLREAVRLAPSDPDVRVDLAHVLHARGHVDEATGLLAEAARQEPADASALRSLVDMYRLAGRQRAALEAAEELAARHPDDLVTLLDLADLHLELGDYDEAAAAMERVRAVDPDPGHASYVLHGLIEIELRRERWRRALDVAISATAADRHQLTTDLLLHVTAQMFGEGERPVPPREALEERLAERRAQHRREHEEALLSEKVGS